jgi:hypothetical protein
MQLLLLNFTLATEFCSENLEITLGKLTDDTLVPDFSFQLMR